MRHDIHGAHGEHDEHVEGKGMTLVCSCLHSGAELRWSFVIGLPYAVNIRPVFKYAI